LFIPQAIHGHGENGGIISAGKNSSFAHQSSLAILPAAESIIRKAGGTWLRK
jgi:hypothetical protein